MDALVASTVRQCTEESSLDHLLRGALCVVAWLWAMDSAATGVVRCADGALACTAGALLTERLATTTADVAAGLGCVGALACSSKLSVNNLVHQSNGCLGVKDFSWQVYRAVGLTLGSVDV